MGNGATTRLRRGNWYPSKRRGRETRYRQVSRDTNRCSTAKGNCFEWPPPRRARSLLICRPGASSIAKAPRSRLSTKPPRGLTAYCIHIPSQPFPAHSLCSTVPISLRLCEHQRYHALLFDIPYPSIEHTLSQYSCSGLVSQSRAAYARVTFRLPNLQGDGCFANPPNPLTHAFT